MRDVIDTWIAQGVAKDRAEGRAEAWTESSIDMLRRLLARRFGPLPKAVEERIASPDIDALERSLHTACCRKNHRAANIYYNLFNALRNDVARQP